LLCCITEIQGNRFIYYGFNVCGHWKDEDYYPLEDIDTEATHEEVETALIAEAKKQGHEYNGYSYNGKTLLGFNSKDGLDCKQLLNNGKWATIIEDNKLNELEKKYKELGKEIQRLKK